MRVWAICSSKPQVTVSEAAVPLTREILEIVLKIVFPFVVVFGVLFSGPVASERPFGAECKAPDKVLSHAASRNAVALCRSSGYPVLTKFQDRVSLVQSVGVHLR